MFLNVFFIGWIKISSKNSFILSQITISYSFSLNIILRCLPMYQVLTTYWFTCCFNTIVTMKNAIVSMVVLIFVKGTVSILSDQCLGVGLLVHTLVFQHQNNFCAISCNACTLQFHECTRTLFPTLVTSFFVAFIVIILQGL